MHEMKQYESVGASVKMDFTNYNVASNVFFKTTCVQKNP